MRVILLCMVFFAVCLSIPCVSQELDPDTILSGVMRAIASYEGISASVRITVCDAGTKTAEKTASFFSNPGSHTYLVIHTRPDTERGVSWLFKANEGWGFAPGIDRFFNATTRDEVNEPENAIAGIITNRFLIDYKPIGVKRSAAGPYPCYELSFESIEPDAEKTFLSIFVLEDSLVPIKAEYSDQARNQIATCYFNKWGTNGSVYLPLRAIVAYTHRQNRSYTFEFENINISQIPDFVFTRAYCEYIGM
jgi:hypothetical protein